MVTRIVKRGCVLCEIRDEAEKVVEHGTYNTTKQHQMAAIRQAKLLLGLL